MYGRWYFSEKKWSYLYLWVQIEGKDWVYKFKNYCENNRTTRLLLLYEYQINIDLYSNLHNFLSIIPVPLHLSIIFSYIEFGAKDLKKAESIIGGEGERLEKWTSRVGIIEEKRKKNLKKEFKNSKKYWNWKQSRVIFVKHIRLAAVSSSDDLKGLTQRGAATKRRSFQPSGPSPRHVQPKKKSGPNPTPCCHLPPNPWTRAHSPKKKTAEPRSHHSKNNRVNIFFLQKVISSLSPGIVQTPLNTR